ncbi:MBL fold metallo-hydrolase RNA specificity domain-containing protein [Planctomycetota bacterium]
MLLYDDGLFLLTNRLGIDVRRPLPNGFISHAHFDHMAKHQTAFCTPETARLYRHRIGDRPVRCFPFHQPTDYAGVTLTTLPAGHMLGSAMLLVEQNDTRLLYTGDFQLKETLTCRKAIVPKVDVLVMECTFGRPQFSFPDRTATVKRLVSTVRSIMLRGNVPVIEAYVAGKAQEVTRILTRAEIPVVQHPEIFAISEVYSELGQDLGKFRCYGNSPVPGAALIVPPSQQRAASIGDIHRQERIAITGWAMRNDEARRRKVQHVIPLSDHADYNELLELVETAKPSTILCVHGPKEFSDDLQSRGHDARYLHRDEAYCPLR